MVSVRLRVVLDIGLGLGLLRTRFMFREILRIRFRHMVQHRFGLGLG